MLNEELNTFFPELMKLTIGEKDFYVGEFSFEEYLSFLHFFSGEKDAESLRVFLRRVLGENFDDLSDDILWKVSEILLKKFQEEESNKKQKGGGELFSIIRQMTFLMMKTSFTEKELLRMPYKRFFYYLEQLGYWMRAETKEGQEENKRLDALKKYSGKEAETESYYDSKKKFEKRKSLRK